MAKKLLLLGSIVSACPPKKYGGSERVAYSQAKELAKRSVEIVFIGAKGTSENFRKQLELEGEDTRILKKIEFVEIGGGTQLAETEDSLLDDPVRSEASRKLRREMVGVAWLIELILSRKDEFGLILNNMRGVEAVLVPLCGQLNIEFLTVLHLNLFDDLVKLFRKYNTAIIAISEHQKQEFPKLNYVATIPNPINSRLFTHKGGDLLKLNDVVRHKDYALFIGSMAPNKNPKDAILAAREAGLPLILAGKISNQEYFEKEIQPHVDGLHITFLGEVGLSEKIKLYRGAKAFLFPVVWQEPFGLVVVEALVCGTPVIAYPHGGPKEIVKNGLNGFLVKNVTEMAEAIKKIESINPEDCRSSAARYDEEKIGEKYFEIISSLLFPQK